MSLATQDGVRPSAEARIAAHVRAWEKARLAGGSRVVTRPFVTIAHEHGCEAVPLAHQLVDLLNERCRPVVPWFAYDRELLAQVAQELHLQQRVVEALEGVRRSEMTELFDAILNPHVPDVTVVRKLAEVIRSLAVHGHTVLVGRCGNLISQDLKTGLHVQLVAPRAWRLHALSSDLSVSHHEAETFLNEHEREQRHFVDTFFVQDTRHPFYYDLSIDNSRFNLAQIAEIIFTALGSRFGEILVGD